MGLVSLALPGCFPAPQERRYAGLKPGELPTCESLKDTIARALPFWNEEIVPQIKAGKRVLIAAHGNSLRGIVKHLEGTAPCPPASSPAWGAPHWAFRAGAQPMMAHPVLCPVAAPRAPAAEIPSDCPMPRAMPSRP